MEWEELPAWAKGGVIALLIWLLLLAFVLLFINVPLLQFVAYFLDLFFFLIPMLLLGLYQNGMNNETINSSRFLLGFLYLVIGAFVGWIVGKVKGRKAVIAQ